MPKSIIQNIDSVKPAKYFRNPDFKEVGLACSFAKSLDFYETLFRTVQIFGIMQIFEISKEDAGICQIFRKTYILAIATLQLPVPNHPGFNRRMMV